MTWMCECLGLPDPDLPDVPDLGVIERDADAYVGALLRGWRAPLRDVPEERFGGRTYTSRWGEAYTIDAMLEHAVMHPIRHAFQLEELIERAEGA
jgi:hypothetical protein